MFAVIQPKLRQLSIRDGLMLPSAKRSDPVIHRYPFLQLLLRSVLRLIVSIHPFHQRLSSVLSSDCLLQPPRPWLVLCFYIRNGSLMGIHLVASLKYLLQLQQNVRLGFCHRVSIINTTSHRRYLESSMTLNKTRYVQTTRLSSTKWTLTHIIAKVKEQRFEMTDKYICMFYAHWRWVNWEIACQVFEIHFFGLQGYSTEVHDVNFRVHLQHIRRTIPST